MIVVRMMMEHCLDRQMVAQTEGVSIESLRQLLNRWHEHSVPANATIEIEYGNIVRAHWEETREEKAETSEANKPARSFFLGPDGIVCDKCKKPAYWNDVSKPGRWFHKYQSDCELTGVHWVLEKSATPSSCVHCATCNIPIEWSSTHSKWQHVIFPENMHQASPKGPNMYCLECGKPVQWNEAQRRWNHCELQNARHDITPVPDDEE